MIVKITFNPVIKNHKAYFKPFKTNVSKDLKQVSLNGLNCVANYNFSFGTRAIYALDYDGSYEKFSQVGKAVEKYGQSVNSVLSGEHSASGDKTFLYADSVEFPDGSVNDKIIKNALLSFRDARNQPIYSITYDGEIRRFDNAIEASKILGVDKGSINRVLNKDKMTVLGYTFARAIDIEQRDEKGKLLFDENENPLINSEGLNKARENFLHAGKHFPIVGMDKNKQLTIYKNIDEAAIKTNNKVGYIRYALANGASSFGIWYVKLEDVVAHDKHGNVLYNPDGTYRLDEEKVKYIGVIDKTRRVYEIKLD